MKKISVSGELSYIFALSLISLSVAMAAAADFGVSMIAAPTYILSLKFPFLSFGQWEYVVQGLLFVLMCVMLRGFKPIYLISFLSGVVYGSILDFWRSVLPMLNPAVTAPGSMPMGLRLALFVIGELICGVGVALAFKTYIYPQVYDFFVKAVAEKRGFNRTKLKRIFDASFLAVAVALALLMFRGFEGMGWGTVVLTLVNGPVIGFFDKWLDKHFDFKPALPKIAKHFI